MIRDDPVGYWLDEVINELERRLDNLKDAKKRGDLSVRDFAAELAMIRGVSGRAHTDCMDKLIDKNELEKIFGRKIE
jgi:hypothetical protein